MLQTLIKLGSQLSHNRGEWDDIIDYPDIQKEKKNSIKLYVAELVFDLDNQDVFVSPSLHEYDEEKSCIKYKNVKILTGRNNSFYACVELNNIVQLQKTFFGKYEYNDSEKDEESEGNIESEIPGENSELDEGELVKALKKFPELKETALYNMLPSIYKLKDVFLSKIWKSKKEKGATIKVIDLTELLSNIHLGKNDKIVIIYASVKSENFEKTMPICEIEGFQTFLRTKFLEKKQSKTDKLTYQKICYATGVLNDDVSEVDFSDRYNLNKMFVKETKNYASSFDKNSFFVNYQVSANNQLLLNRASKYLLENQKVRIAGIDHCIIPQFLNNDDVDIPYITKGIFQKTELLFSMDSLDKFATNAEYEIDTDSPFWITYLAFESDGKFFKTISEIKDVSRFHFYEIIEAFKKINTFFKEDLKNAVDWLSVMTDYGKQHNFNLASIYSIIPLRKDKEKKNDVLALFKLIFENRKIEPDKLYKHFCDLVLCHRYKRYEAFKNVKKYDDKYFDFAIRDSVFKYFALIQTLKRLNLLQKMEENETITNEVSENGISEFQQKINTFFTKMDFNADQKAMFYLGRMLSSVAYIQKDKSKNVLEKVNFSGMDRTDIIRLRNSLIEKAKQYSELSKVIFSDAEFSASFNFNDWKKKPEESVFFLLSGYSFGIIKSTENK